LSQRVDARCAEVVECAPNLWSREWDIIGEGSSARVFKEIMFNENVAIKGWRGAFYEDELLTSLAKLEASVMAKVNHPGIVPLVGVGSHPYYGPCLIME
jgi:serine/threonine protein kinase